MKWLVDTDVAPQGAKPCPDRRVLEWLKRNARDCFLSRLTLAELACGVQGAPEERQADLAAWLAALRAEAGEAILSVDEAVLMVWKELLAELQGQGVTIACEDSLLVARARALGLGVATLNRRHFEAAGCHCADFGAAE